MTSGRRHLLTLAVGISLGALLTMGWTKFFAASSATPPRAAASAGARAEPPVPQQSVAESSPANATRAAAAPGLTFEDQQRFAEILQRVRREYVDEVPREQLLEAAARGMVAGLDPYSAYLDQREFEEIRRGVEVFFAAARERGATVAVVGRVRVCQHNFGATRLPRTSASSPSSGRV